MMALDGCSLSVRVVAPAAWQTVARSIKKRPSVACWQRALCVFPEDKTYGTALARSTGLRSCSANQKKL
ncbi:protein of unknown function [Pseudomonas sp. JV551A1]|uniref:Uncharacterized protein n=1 Tax=Pseudomonas inefficax TaxID=2078786 RepID=A0AAQ1SW70_9PSED|nr:protein of unknown function [Pseudomonas sp. JV551A1]SPO63861.1 protein of unknown function [Pseudomonas inefficax]